MKDLTNMRKTAEAAQGILSEPWIVMETGSLHVAVVEQSKHDGSIISGGTVAEAGHIAFRDHIATFDPPTVLALITRLEQAEQAVARVREVATGDPTEYGWSEAMLAVLRALDGDTRG